MRYTFRGVDRAHRPGHDPNEFVHGLENYSSLRDAQIRAKALAEEWQMGVMFFAHGREDDPDYVYPDEFE